VKKIAGREKSKPVELTRYVRNDGDLIREQIELLNPTVVVCGGTWKLANLLIPGLSLSKPYSFDQADGRIWLSCFHPSLRGKTADHFDQVVSVYRNALAASGWVIGMQRRS
jgi:hypothetical protein